MGEAGRLLCRVERLFQNDVPGIIDAVESTAETIVYRASMS